MNAANRNRTGCGRRWRVRIAAGCGGLLLSLASAAAGVSPYAPLQLAPELERDLERVLILGDQPVMRRPVPLGWVAESLPRACSRDAPLCKRIGRYLQRVVNNGVNLASVELAAKQPSTQPLPNRHGMASDSAWQLAVAATVQPGDYLLLSLGALLNGTHRTATGSMLSVGLDSLQVDAGFRDHWLSPLTDSAMLIGSEAATMPSLTVSNWRPLTRISFGYEVFAARMSTSNRIAFESGYTSGSPRLAGLSLSIAPWRGWSVGVNRLVHYGGGQRGGNSLRDVLRALFNPHGADNLGPGLPTSSEQGNQVASIVSRMTFNGRTSFAVYTEYAGEDTSYASNFRLGNAALAAGLDFPHLPHNLDATYEATEWQNGWYVHHIYGDGLTNHGNVIGNWFGDWRLPGDAVGGRQQMLRIGWHPDDGRVLALRYRTLTNACYAHYAYHRGEELTVDYSRPWRGARIGTTVEAGRDVFGERFGRVAAFMRFDDSAGPYGDAGATATASAAVQPDAVQRFIDAGASSTRILFESSDLVPDTTSAHFSSPHLGLGARRAVSEHQDLGVRVEYDRVNGYPLLALRALDYRYRLGRHAAASAFFGAARYQTGTPAFGYYMGAGAQWRDLIGHLDFNLDVRFGDKLARDALLPGDPPTTRRPDMFYGLRGAAAYLSLHY